MQSASCARLVHRRRPRTKVDHEETVGFTAAALAAVGVALAPAAMADPNDDAYLADHLRHDVQSPAHAIDSGHKICNDLVAGFGRQLIIDNTAKSGTPTSTQPKPAAWSTSPSGNCP